VVDEFVFLAFAQCVDGELELLLGLVVGLVVEVGDAGVDAENGLCQGEFVFAGGEFVVDEGAGDPWLAGVAGAEVDAGFAVLVGVLGVAVGVLGQCVGEFGMLGGELGE